MYNELPAVKSTSAERLQALKDAKLLVTSTPGDGGMVEVFNGKKPTPTPDVHAMLRVAEYITTGHDYMDTHDEREQEKAKVIVDLTSNSGQETITMELDLTNIGSDKAVDMLHEAVGRAMEDAEARDALAEMESKLEDAFKGAPKIVVEMNVEGLSDKEAVKAVTKRVRKLLAEHDEKNGTHTADTFHTSDGEAV